MSLQRFDAVGFLRRLVSIVQATCLSQSALAAKCAMPLPTFKSYLYTDTLPGARALFNLAQGLNVSADWLLFGGCNVRRAA